MTHVIDGGTVPSKRRLRRTGALIACLATVLGIWLGVSAPTVSPVAPTAVAEQATVGTLNQNATDTPTTFVQHHHGRR